MNQQPRIDIRHSTCPHDCPSACALDIEVIGGQTIGRVRGSKLHSYTAGVVCAKVARYAERIHHPDRLMHPMRRTGPKGSGQFARISWDEALDEIAARFDAAEREFGAESVWPYYYAGGVALQLGAAHPPDGLAADHLDIEGAGGRTVMRTGGMPDVDLGVLVHGLEE